MRSERIGLLMLAALLWLCELCKSPGGLCSKVVQSKNRFAGFETLAGFVGLFGV